MNRPSTPSRAARSAARGFALPKAPGLPLIGSIPALLRKRFDFFEQARARCGDIFMVDLGVEEIVVVADPEAAEEVFVHRSKNFHKGGGFWEGLREAIGNGLAISEGELWRRQRRLMNPEFRRARIAGFRATITETIEELLAELERPSATGETIDISVWTSKLLATLTVRLLLGSELDSNTFDRFRDALGVMLDGVLAGIVTRELPSWVPVPGAARFESARATIDEIILRIIADRRASPSRGDNLLSMLLEVTDSEGKMSDKQLRDEVVLTYLAGFETTAWALAWGIMLLAEHPAFTAELQSELDAHEDPLTAPLLDATVREILRMYPSAPFLPRTALVDEELLGYPIPANTTVVVSPWLVHRNPRVWPHPTRFDPRRHFEDVERPRLAWMPFGAGQRLCIGMGLAMMEAKLTLSTLLRRFTPMVGKGHRRSEPRLSTSLASRDGVWVRLARRPA